MIHSEGLTTRQHILDDLKTIVEEIADDSSNPVFKQVELTRTIPSDLETVALPACFIYSDREYRVEDERAVIGKETWEWYIVLEVWAVEEEMEALLKFIHAKLYDHYTVNNYVHWAERMGVDFLTIDPTKSIESMALPYRLVYRHSLGVM
jgi:hypothetical protein